MTRTLTMLFAVFACLRWTPAHALSYSAEPFQATIVDAETKQPLEGVIVVVSWILEDRSGHSAGALHTFETVTDAAGSVRAPSWGPLEVPNDANIIGLPPRLSPDAPTLYVFKAGYTPSSQVTFPGTSVHLNDPFWVGDPVRLAHWNGKTLQMTRFRGSDRQYLAFLQMISFNASGGPCGWFSAPRIAIALNHEGERLKYLFGYNPVLRKEAVSEYVGSRYCGSITETFGDQLK